MRARDGIFCVSSSLLRSPDQGRTWEVEETGPLSAWPYFYWLCERGGRVFCLIGRYQDGSFTKATGQQRGQFLNTTPIRHL